MKVAIVFDSLDTYGGAERMLEVFLSLYPSADVYTLMYRRESFPKYWKNYSIKPLLPYFRLGAQYPQLFGSTFVQLFRSIRFDEYHFVISLDRLYAKMIGVPASAFHVCYQFTPAHILYPFTENITSHRSLLTVSQKSLLRDFDYMYAQQVDLYVTISHTVALRVKSIYGIDPVVIYPCTAEPIVSSPNALPQDLVANKYFLIVSRLTEDKSLGWLIRLSQAMPYRLVVVGDGHDRKKLEKIGSAKVVFTGYVDDATKRSLYRSCMALIIPGEEDFGLTAAECLQQGKPVLCYGRGGVTEIVTDGVHGLYFSRDNFLSVLNSFFSYSFDEEICRARGDVFSYTAFKTAWNRLLTERMNADTFKV